MCDQRCLQSHFPNPVFEIWLDVNEALEDVVVGFQPSPLCRFPTHKHAFFFSSHLSPSLLSPYPHLSVSQHTSLSAPGASSTWALMKYLSGPACVCVCRHAMSICQLPQEYHLAALLGSQVTLNDLSEMWTVLLRIIFCEMKTSVKAVNCPQAKIQAAECISVVHRIWFVVYALKTFSYFTFWC